MLASLMRVILRGLMVKLLGLSLAWLLLVPQTSFAHTMCPNSNVHGTTGPASKFAYQLVKRHTGTCTNQIAISSNGSRVFSSRADCRNGRFNFVGEQSRGILPSPLNCTNCTAVRQRDVIIAPDSSAQISAYSTFFDGKVLRYTSTISRGPADANGRTSCSISNASIAGASLGGDATSPTVVIGALTGPIDGTYTAAITFSEASTNFARADLSLSNSTATLSGSGINYTATLTPAGDVKLSVLEGAFTDAATNTSTASNEVIATFDGTLRSVVISDLPQRVLGTTTFNATVAGISGTDAIYTLSVLATGQGGASLHIPENRAQDGAGNGSAASNTAIVSNKTVIETQKKIAQFMATRANQLVANRSDLTCFLAGACSAGGFDPNVTKGQMNFNLTPQSGSPVWCRLKGSRSKSGTVHNDDLFGAIGAHRHLNQNTLLGLTLELDHQSRIDGVAKVDGTDWLVGPYIVGRLPNQPLFYEARAFWGKTNNTISRFGTDSDTFETERFLIQAKALGKLEYGATTLTPSLSGAFTKDTQIADTDSLGNVTPQQRIELGQLALGLNFNTPVDLGRHNWDFGGRISAIYTSTKGSGATASFIAPYDGGRACVHVSASHTFSAKSEIVLGAFYDGIGAKNYKS